MTQSIDLGWTLAPVTVPQGTVVGSIQASIVGAVNTTPVTLSAAAGATSIVFPNVAADTYQVAVQALDANGAALGTPAVTTIVVTAPLPVTVTIQIPGVVTATVTSP